MFVRLITLCVALQWFASFQCTAQVPLPGGLGATTPGGQYPVPEYYIALEVYRSGDLENALSALENALGRSRKDINGRWLDAIPIHAMLAECYWQIGNLPLAHANVDAAMQIAVRNRGWLARVDWTSAVREGVVLSPPIGLWPDATSVRRIPISDSIKYVSGNPVTEQSIAQGGVVEPPNLRGMDVAEILRGLAVASYRRRIIMGPLSKGDPLVGEVVAATGNAGAPTPIASSMIGCLNATARFANQDDRRVLTDASAYTLLGGGSHTLSPIMLLTQATTLAETDRAEGCLAASIATVNVAAALEQHELIGDAMQLAAGVASEKEAGIIRLAAESAANAMVRKSRLAAVHCFVAAADAAVTARQYDAAKQSLSNAKLLSDRRDVWTPRVDAYGAYVAARLAAISGDSFGVSKPTMVDNAYTSMTNFAQYNKIRNRPFVSMPSVYQFALVSKTIGTRAGASTSDAVLEYYSGDPPYWLWRRDPVDAFTFLTLDRSGPLNARLAFSAASSDGDDVLLRSDALLAERFAQTLPISGRVANVRALAGRDSKLLNDAERQFRDQGPPEFKKLRELVLGNAKLNGNELNFQAVEKLSAEQESLATSIAFTRGSLPRLVPPRLNTKASLDKLPKTTALVSFAFSGNVLHTTYTVAGKTRTWPMPNTSRLPSMITSVLRGIGVGKARGSKISDKDAWKKDAATLMRQLFPEATLFTTAKIDQVLICPDGLLWYLPFELLPIDGESSELLGDKFQIRYAATPGIAIHATDFPRENKTVGIAASRFFSPRDLELNTSITQSIVDAADGSVLLPNVKMPPSTTLGLSIGELIVASPMTMDVANPYGMSVLPYEEGKPGASLAAWMRLPSLLPSTVALAGFRSQAEAARLGDGREIFLTLCALNTAGVRDVLLSRWAVGGESTAIALREFAQELPFSGMPTAWNRARMVLRRSDLDPLSEPLLSHDDKDIDSITGEEPLFWAGYLLSSPIE